MNSAPWPYPTPGAAIAPSPRLGGMYTSHAPSKSTLLSMGSPQVRMAGYQRISEFDLSTADAHVFSRPAAGMDSVPYENEPSANYSQSPAYMLPNVTSGAMMDYGAFQWSPKIWDSVLNAGRPNGGTLPDPEANSSLHQSPFAYMLPSQGFSSTELAQTTTAAMAAVSSPDVSGPDRTLSTPTCRSQQLSSGTASLNILSSEAIPNLTLPSDYKSTFWNQRCGNSPDQRATPTHTIPSNAPFSSSTPPSIKCTSANTTAPELLFAYLPMPTTAEDTTSPLSSAAAPLPSTTSSANDSFTGLESLNTSSTEYRAMTCDTRLSRSFSREQSSTGQRLISLANDCSPDIYGYTSSEKKIRTTDDSDSRCSTATLMSGLPYHRVRHPEASNAAFCFNLLPDALPEYHRGGGQNVHRAPVSPLGNQGAY